MLSSKNGKKTLCYDNRIPKNSFQWAALGSDEAWLLAFERVDEGIFFILSSYLWRRVYESLSRFVTSWVLNFNLSFTSSGWRHHPSRSLASCDAKRLLAMVYNKTNEREIERERERWSLRVSEKAKGEKVLKKPSKLKSKTYLYKHREKVTNMFGEFVFEKKGESGRE